MSDQWLVHRLTKSKQGSPRWVELAEALEEFWDSQFFSHLQELEDSKNIFTAGEDALNQKMSEYGSYFDTTFPLDESSKRLTVAWQLADIHKKDTINPFVNSLYRNFKGLSASWENLYCRIGNEYSQENLHTLKKIQQNGDSLDQYWLTSRGRVTVDIAHLQKAGLTRDEFKTIARREVERYRPSHIVYDGELFLLVINFEFKPLTYGIISPKSTTHGIQFDLNEEHGNILIFQQDRFETTITSQIHYAPLSIIQPNYNHRSVSLSTSMVLITQSRSPSVVISNMDYCLQRQFDISSADTIPLDTQMIGFNHLPSNQEQAFDLSDRTNTNPWVGFDQIPSDFAPLDTPLWEQ